MKKRTIVSFLLPAIYFAAVTTGLFMTARNSNAAWPAMVGNPYKFLCGNQICTFNNSGGAAESWSPPMCVHTITGPGTESFNCAGMNQRSETNSLAAITPGRMMWVNKTWFPIQGPMYFGPEFSWDSNTNTNLVATDPVGAVRCDSVPGPRACLQAVVYGASSCPSVCNGACPVAPPDGYCPAGYHVDPTWDLMSYPVPCIKDALSCSVPVADIPLEQTPANWACGGIINADGTMSNVQMCDRDESLATCNPCGHCAAYNHVKGTWRVTSGGGYAENARSNWWHIYCPPGMVFWSDGSGSTDGRGCVDAGTGCPVPTTPPFPTFTPQQAPPQSACYGPLGFDPKYCSANTASKGLSSTRPSGCDGTAAGSENCKLTNQLNTGSLLKIPTTSPIPTPIQPTPALNQGAGTAPRRDGR